MTIVKNNKLASNSTDLASSMQNDDFNPDQYVDKIWANKVIPYINDKAKPITEVIAAIKSDADKAGQSYGIRSDNNSPWNYIVKGKVKVVGVETTSQAGLLDVELEPKDPESALSLAIGPVFKKTSIRDALDFIKFDDFKNQIQYAQLANSFNKAVKDQVISKLKVNELMGKELDAVGIMTLDSTGKYTLMPVSLLTVEGGK